MLFFFRRSEGLRDRFALGVADIFQYLTSQGAFDEWLDAAFQFLVVKTFLSDPALVNIPIIGITPKGSNEDRARAWRLRAKQGKVKLVKGLWNLDFVRVASSFPNGRHDDDVDSVSGGVEMLAGEGGNTVTATAMAVVVEAEELFSF